MPFELVMIRVLQEWTAQRGNHGQSLCCSMSFINSDIIRALEMMAHFMKEEAKFGKWNHLFKVEHPINKRSEPKSSNWYLCYSTLN